MSDKNRNMNDINDQKTAEQQAFSEEIRRRLAEPGSGKPTLDEFKGMVYKDREKRRKKRNALVACLVAAFIVGFLSFDALVPKVGADKNPKETIQTEDGVIIEDGGYGSSVGDNEVQVVTQWNEVERLKKRYSNMLIPKFIPNGYKFKSLSIEKTEAGALMYMYCFETKCNSIKIEIFQYDGGEDTQLIFKEEKTLLCEKGTIYCVDKEKATIKLNDGILVVYGKLPDADKVKLIENIN